MSCKFHLQILISIILIIFSLTSCSQVKVEKGTPKRDVIKRYGTPKEFMIVKNKRFSKIGYSSDLLGTCEKSQPVGERWVWTYANGISVTLEDNKVTDISHPGDKVAASTSELHEAAKEGNTQKVKELLLGGADPNAKTKNGSTPLHYALINEHKELAHVLIKGGADPASTNNDGLTPEQAAKFIEMASEAGKLSNEDVEMLSGEKMIKILHKRGYR